MPLSIGSSLTLANTTPFPSPQHRHGNRRQNHLVTWLPFHPLPHTLPFRPTSRSRRAQPTDHPRHLPFLITGLGKRRRMPSPISSRSFIAISPPSRQRSYPIQVNRKTRAVSSSRAARAPGRKRLRKVDGRRGSTSTSSEHFLFLSLSKRYKHKTCVVSQR